MSDNFAFSQGLIVDSSFDSRLKLSRDVQALGLFERVIDAKSLLHGLDLLKSKSPDAVVIGPSVSRERAIDFITRAKKIPNAVQCAYIAVVNQSRHNSSDNSSGLTNFGIHGVIQRPYTKGAFSQIVAQAVREASGRTLKEPTRIYEIDAPFEMTLTDEPERAFVLSDAQSSISLCRAIEQAASGLREVATLITAGKLGLVSNGLPDERTKRTILDVIAKTLSQSPESSSELNKDDSFDHFFSVSLSEWFEDRVRNSADKATERLRRKLLGFSLRNS